MKRLARWIGAAVSAACLGIGLGASPALAQPPLWKVSDADSTLYLFGTVHVLRPETQWRSKALDDAFGSAGEVWFEVDPVRLGDPVLMGRLFPLLLDTAKPLSAKLSPEVHARLVEAATALGANPAQLEPFKPAAAATMLASLAIVKAGYSPESGVDKVLRATMGEQGIRELETAEQQFRFLADLPEDVQKVMLEETLEDMADLGHLDRVVDSWAEGDISQLEDLFLAELMNEHPHAYDVFVRTRNRAWADELAAEMAGAGKDFIAVGALHLVGPDGLPTLMEQQGFTVERVH